MVSTVPYSFNKLTYRADIDGLRAVAILSVLFFHAFPEFLPGGFVGVDIFFVISGYLISGIIFKGLSLETFSFFDFYARRVRRIFPSVFIVLLLTTIAGYWLLTPYEFRDLISDVPYSAFFLENWHLYYTTGGYWDVATESRPLMHFWSLGVEEQYYIFYPLICFIFWRIRKTFFLSILLILFVVSFTLCLYETSFNTVRAFYSLHSRFWELLVGGLLAYIEILGLTKRYQEFNYRNLISVIGFLLLFLSISFISEKDFPGWKALFPTIGTVLIIAAGKDAYLNRVVLSQKFVVFVGLISYPLYLWHWPLLTIIRSNWVGEVPNSVVFVILAVAVILAYLTYTLIERPIRQCKASLPLVLVLVSTLSVFVVAVTYFEQNIRQQRFSNTVISLLESEMKGLTKKDKACTDLFGKNHKVCHSSGVNPSILITGDSHAYWYWNAIKKSSLDVYLVANAGGSIFENSVKRGRNTLKQTEQIWKQIRGNNIQTVVFIGYWPSYLTAMNFRDFPALTRREAFEKSWDRTLRELTHLKKNIIVVVDSPRAEFDPKDRCFQLRKFVFQDRNINSCAVERQLLEKKDFWIRRFFKNLQAQWPNVTFIDSWDKLCDAEFCYFAKGNELFYRDEHHLTTYGVEEVWPIIESKLKETLPNHS